MKKYIAIVALGILSYSCNTVETIEKTDKTFPDGTPEVVTRFIDKEGTLVPHSRVNYYPDKKVMIKGNLDENGKRHGRWESFYDSGKHWSLGDYKNGVEHGKRIVWFENGTKRYEGQYTDGEKTGNWKFWGEDGELVKEVNF